MLKTRKFSTSRNANSLKPVSKGLNKGVIVPNSLDKKKEFFSNWIKENKIPGKAQAWFFANSDESFSDWKIINELQGKHHLLKIIPPCKGFSVPTVVQEIHTQIRKEHLKAFKNALQQIYFKALGNSQYALLLQANLHGANSLRGYRSFLEYLQRIHGETILACFHIECRPSILFDPSNPPRSLSLELKEGFGGEFHFLENLPVPSHILDKLPQQKRLWTQFPEKLKDFIHPSTNDYLFMFHASSGILPEILCKHFSHVECAEAHAYGEKAAKLRKQNSSESFKVHRGAPDPKWIEKIFSQTEKEKNWTIYLGPENNEHLSAQTISALVKTKPARILLLSSSLEEAQKNIKQFRNNGYILRKMLPIDFEPNTPTINVLFLFVPDRNGLLGDQALNQAKKRAIRPKERKNNLQKQDFFDFEQDIPHFVQRKRTLSDRND